LFCEYSTLNNILFTHKFFQSNYLSDWLITSAQNVVPVHARPQSLSWLADSRVNDSLLQIIKKITRLN